ncbi:MAG: hypothetical protein ACJA1L_001605 [Paracoccaceae bacterium]
MRFSFLSFACILALAACGGGAGGKIDATPGVGADATPRIGGKIVIRDQHVNWSDITQRNAAPQDGLRHFIFVITPTKTKTFHGLDEEDLVREAARKNMSVEAFKQMLAKQPYKLDGANLVSCTYRAAERGLCKGPRYLPLDQRVALAREVLEKDGRCRWAGFDPAFNAAKSHISGAANAMVHFRADCR